MTWPLDENLDMVFSQLDACYATAKFDRSGSPGSDVAESETNGVVLFERRLTAALSRTFWRIEFDGVVRMQRGDRSFDVPGNLTPNFPSPLWFLDLLRGFMVREQRQFALTPQGERQVEMVGSADLAVADRRSRFGLAVPSGSAIRTLRDIDTRVVLDDAGRVIKVVCETERVGRTLDLSSYGSALSEHPELMAALPAA